MTAIRRAGKASREKQCTRSVLVHNMFCRQLRKKFGAGLIYGYQPLRPQQTGRRRRWICEVQPPGSIMSWQENENERKRALLDAPLGPGFAVTVAGPVAGASWTRGGRCCSSPIGQVDPLSVRMGRRPPEIKSSQPAGYIGWELSFYRASHREGMT
jgi:hypothetical protein